jgi:hypothetical protein
MQNHPLDMQKIQKIKSPSHHNRSRPHQVFFLQAMSAVEFFPKLARALMPLFHYREKSLGHRWAICIL